MAEIEAGVETAAGKKLAPPKPFLAETTLETRNPLAVLFSRYYLRANVMGFSVWFFALLGFYGLTSWLAIILGQHGFSVVKSILFITTITLGGIPGFKVITAKFLKNVDGSMRTDAERSGNIAYSSAEAVPTLTSVTRSHRKRDALAECGFCLLAQFRHWNEVVFPVAESHVLPVFQF
jgi:hypothetical protein